MIEPLNEIYKTREQRRRDMKRIQREKFKADVKSKDIATKDQKKFPPLIMTIAKRLKRIDPWNGIASMDPWTCSLICFFRLNQFGIDNLRIATTQMHSWVEFNYDDEWWIFDPIAVSNTSLGDPVKREKYLGVPQQTPLKQEDEWKEKINLDVSVKREFEVSHQEYIDLKRYYTDINNFISAFDNKIDLTPDEAKIEAMKDDSLNSVLRIKYH